MEYQISTSQPTAISSDDEWDLFETSQDDSESSNESIQDPEYLLTWKFNEQPIVLNVDEITEEIEEIDEPRLVKLGRANVEIVSKIKYRLEFEEYLETSEDGVACVYNVASMDTEKALEIFDLKNIQYSYKDGTTHESVFCPFLNTKVYKETRTCRGVKICQFAAPELTTMTHISHIKYYVGLFPQTGIQCNGKPKLNTHYQDDTSVPTYFIGCENFKNSERGHRYQSLSGRINIEYLKKLFREHIYYNNGITEEISDSIRHCYMILPYSAKAKKCSYIHTTENSEVAQGLIQTKSKCPVKFWHYVPKDLENSIQNDLKDIIAEEDILDLTARKLITRTSMQRFLKGVPLSELHPSLNNRSKIEHMIATKRHAEHPYGQDIMGVAHILLKQKQDNDDDLYIRTICRANVEIVSKIKYRLEFEEYLETSEDGVACVYNVASMDTEKALEIFDLKNIQYSYKDGTTHESVFCPFLNTKVYKETRTCRGVKICQFAAPELTTMTHISHIKYYVGLFPQTGIQCNGKPKLNTHYQDDTSVPTYFIGCENFKNSERGHRYQSLSGRINIEYLKKLFREHIYYNNGITEEISDSIRHCYMILPYSAKAKKCSYIHTTENSEVAQGLIQTKSKCPVKFWHYVPKDLENSIQNDLKDIIAEEDILDLTARKLITRTSMQRFLKGVPLSELHPSLNNRSKIEHMIATKRHAEHPYGQDIMGVAHILLKQKQDNDDDLYIRTICFFDNSQYLILCDYKSQMKYLANSLYFEIDMSFKHELFTCVEQDCGHSVEFQHIHSREIEYILADEHYGQALGLGQYLAERFPIFNATEHLERIYKLSYEVMNTLEFLEHCEIPGIANWVQDKKQPWILAGLSPAFTKMEQTIWTSTPFTTNAGESAHTNINRNGHNLSLLAAIN
ncbi:18504_t:CDS:10, partial [Racocetra persica]